MEAEEKRTGVFGEKQMRLVVVDETDNVIVEYDESKFREVLKKYIEILGDFDKAFKQLSEDLLDKARQK
jgi:hypothetical protein